MIRAGYARLDIIGFSKMRCMVLNMKEHMFDLFQILLLLSTGWGQQFYCCDVSELMLA